MRLRVERALSLENPRHIFPNSHLASFGLPGSGKIVDISSLPSRRQRFKGSLQIRKLIQHGLEFFRDAHHRNPFHFQASFFCFDSFPNISSQDRFHLRDFSHRGELDPACRLRVLTGPGEDTRDIFQQGAFEEDCRAKDSLESDSVEDLFSAGEWVCGGAEKHDAIDACDSTSEPLAAEFSTCHKFPLLRKFHTNGEREQCLRLPANAQP